MLAATHRVRRRGAEFGAPAMAATFTAAPTAAPHTSCPTRRRASPSVRCAAHDAAFTEQPLAGVKASARVARGAADRGLRADRRHSTRRARRHATARSTGSACRASTRPRVSRRCWARRSNGRWLIAPARAPPASTRRRYRARRAGARDGVGDGRRRGPRHRLHAAARRAGRARAHRRGHQRQRADAMELILRFDYGTLVPWVHRVGGDTLRRRRARTPSACARLVPTHGEDLRTRAPSSPSTRASTCRSS